VVTDREGAFGRLVGKTLFISILIALFWSPLWFGTPQHPELQKTLQENSVSLKPETASPAAYVSSAYVALFQNSYPNKVLEYFLFFIGILTVAALLSKCRVLRKSHSVTYVGLGWAFLMLAVMASGKTAKIPEYRDPWGGALFILYGAFFYAATVSFLTRRRRELAAVVICLGTLFVAQNAFFQICGGLEKTRELFAQEHGFESFAAYTNEWFKTTHEAGETFTMNRLLSDRVSSNFTSPNILACHCMIAALLGLGLFKSGGKKLVKGIGLAAAFLALAVLFFTRSKSVIVLTFALITLWAFILYRAKALSLNLLAGVFIAGAVYTTVNLLWGYGASLGTKLSSSGDVMRIVGAASLATLSPAYSTRFENPYWSTSWTPHCPCILASSVNANLKRPSPPSSGSSVFPCGRSSVGFIPPLDGFADISTRVPARVAICEGAALVISPGSRRVYSGYVSLTARLVKDGIGTDLTV